MPDYFTLSKNIPHKIICSYNHPQLSNLSKGKPHILSSHFIIWY